MLVERSSRSRGPTGEQEGGGAGRREGGALGHRSVNLDRCLDRLLVDFDDAPGFSRSGAPGERERRLGVRQARRARRRAPRARCLRRSAATARQWRRTQSAQQRIGEAVALLPRDDQVDVLEPREVVLGGARACGAGAARSR